MTTARIDMMNHINFMEAIQQLAMQMETFAVVASGPVGTDLGLEATL